jgi:hypothetical protein
MNRPSLDVLEEKIVQAVDQYDEVDLRAIVRSCLQGACDARIEELEELAKAVAFAPGETQMFIALGHLKTALTQPDAPVGPPPPSDPETVERVAKAIDRDLQKQWNTVPPAGQVRPQSVDYERTAEVAIRALLNTNDDKEAGE